MNADERIILEALEKAQRYFQPHIGNKEEQYKNEAKVAITEAIRSIVPNYDEWEKKRVRKETISLLENVYHIGLINEEN